jgi:periplasmic protein TonB
MAYADQRMSAGRIWSIVIVAVLHAILGYAFVTGLAYNVIKKAAEDLKTFDVTEEPPPPEEEPPPPQEVKVQPPPVVTPPPMVRIQTPMAPIIQMVREAPPAPITPTAPPAPPAPPAPKVEPARAKGDLRTLFSNDDYPPSALRNNEEGTVRVSLTVGTNGRVSGCTVTQSSGSSALDSATCRIIRSRARFTPARDSSGNAVSDTQNSPPIRWVVPAE